MKKLVISTLFLIGFAVFLVPASAADFSIPDWVKNNALWWAEGKISEQEYLNSIKFLIETEIIVVDTQQSPSLPTSIDRNTLYDAVKELVSPMISPFSKNIVSESDRAVGYVVTISKGEFQESHTFHTFGKFEPGEDPEFIETLQSQGLSSYFLLESLPSKDKVPLYELISRYINPGKTPEPIDIDIDGVSGDGTTIVTANYNKCKLSEYWPYFQNHSFIYQLTNKPEPEIRDRVIFACQGFQVEVRPDKEKIDSSILNSAPFDMRTKKFVVHFFEGEIEQVFSTTFHNFSPAINTLETPFVTLTASGNPIDGSPQFFLESLPSYDKKSFYEFISKYVNPTRIPEPVNVSIDLITGDNTILQRWNYVDCDVTDYTISLDDSILSYPYSDKPQGEIRDKTDFSCAGNHLLVQGIHEIDDFPISDIKSLSTSPEELNLLYSLDTSLENDRVMSYRIHASDGELEFTYTTDEIPIFKGLAQKRGELLTPLHHDKKYNMGFYIESTPDKNKIDFYEFLARYINPGKTPEPIDVDVEVLTGDGRVLETLQYRSCSAIDFDWYSEEMLFTYQITNEMDTEIREKFTFYCDGYTIEVE